MNNERTFGLEVEFISKEANKIEIARVLSRMTGIKVEAQMYNHNVQRGLWKIITDGSLSGGGLELVSPPIKGKEGMAEVEKIMNALNVIPGVKVDRTCGVHVHHDINDMNVEGVKRIVGRYIKAEKAIDSLMPLSRRGDNNRYCRGLSGMSQEHTLEMLESQKTIQGIAHMFGTRYVKLNLQSYIRYGTIEFRQHSGTIEFEKIKNWILLTQRMVEVGSAKRLKYAPAVYKKMSNIVKMFDLNETEETKSIKEFYTARAKALAV